MNLLSRAAIHDPFDQHAGLRNQQDLLETIPGLREITLAVLLACLGDIQRFNTAKTVAAFAGLSPAERQSGKYQTQTRLSKIGDPLLRKALYSRPLLSAGIIPFCGLFANGSKPKVNRVRSSSALPCANS